MDQHLIMHVLPLTLFINCTWRYDKVDENQHGSKNDKKRLITVSLVAISLYVTTSYFSVAFAVANMQSSLKWKNQV